ncbi:hypothetical protein OG689_44580 [Kitasatospora sp. NBC_00240]|uniref:hypothetical protein n=1 Tax=Kitasatospora sp. NBC_00240 TaxID=2903567 RepID=UPI0022539A8F|nr:hypothetical protein [Kitasatospora sp. NBC_00240]MCX5216216.1 hypothetical protein [Kitasatospora sp. NBC_00240]
MTYTQTEINTALSAGIEMTAEAAGQEITDAPFPQVRAAALAILANEARPSNEAASIATAPDDGRAFTPEQVNQAVNRAVDDTAERVGRGCANDRDNLLVNAVLTLLEDPEAEFSDVADTCYGEDPDTIAGWARIAV